MPLAACLVDFHIICFRAIKDHFSECISCTNSNSVSLFCDTTIILAFDYQSVNPSVRRSTYGVCQNHQTFPRHGDLQNIQETSKRSKELHFPVFLIGIG